LSLLSPVIVAISTHLAGTGRIGLPIYATHTNRPISPLGEKQTDLQIRASLPVHETTRRALRESLRHDCNWSGLTRETCNRRKPGEKAGTGADKPLDKSAVPQSNVHDMSLLLDKIIPLFVYPVGFAVAAGLLCLVFLAWGWRRAAATCIAVSTAYLWLAATPAVAALLARSLEAPYPQAGR
jgi:hypothetical protein